MNLIQEQFEAIGTRWVIDYEDPRSGSRRAEMLGAIRERINLFDKTYSRFHADSLVMSMRQPGTYSLPADALPLFSLYKTLYEITDGAVTPFIGSLLEEAGYDANYTLVPKSLHTPPAWDDAVHIEGNSIVIKTPVVIDVGAAGKGYLIDLVCEILDSYEVPTYCVDAGGDIRYKSQKGKLLSVGLENPFNVAEVIGTINLGNKSICASAGNRRAWGGLHHIFDPRTLKPVTAVSATWVMAETALLADALATALFFVPAAALAHRYSFEYLLIGEDNRIQQSPGFQAELFFAV